MVCVDTYSLPTGLRTEHQVTVIETHKSHWERCWLKRVVNNSTANLDVGGNTQGAGLKV